MPECPVCFGDGVIDCRDVDALIEARWSPEQIEAARRRGLVHPVGVIVCEECEATGVVSEARVLDLRAAAVAAVDQVKAKMEDRGL